MGDRDLHQALAGKIKDAYYAARDRGGTMHTAADDAARDCIDGPLAALLAERDRIKGTLLGELLAALKGAEAGRDRLTIENERLRGAIREALVQAGQVPDIRAKILAALEGAANE